MSSPLDALEPKLLWSHFDAIRRVPRPSKHEERIAELVASWASERGFQVLRDAAGSMAIKVPASAGHENAATVILQGHLDMVCEKNSDVEHDFMTQGIEVEVDGDWVVAKGTTLGADNGVGVAAAMAVADDPDAVHGPLEILCTIDEETGLTGAKQLDPSILDGTLMVNLDTEEDGAIYIGCAGGADTDTTLRLGRRRGGIGTRPYRLAVRGLRGGHSGLNIIENRGNAIKIATRALLAAIDDGIDFDLVSIEGGSKHNAIPRETFAVVRLDPAHEDALRRVVDRVTGEVREEFGATDPDLVIELAAATEDDDVRDVVTVHGRDRLLRMLDGLPHGVLAMSRDVPGLVETSSNLAVVRTDSEAAHVVTSHRSSVMSALLAVRRQVQSICEQAGASVTVDDAYPGWKPNPSSPLVQRTVDVFKDMFGATPEVKAIHAGLECGLLIEKKPGMDAVSIGPQIENAHSPEERVQISSVDRFYRHLVGLLGSLA